MGGLAKATAAGALEGGLDEERVVHVAGTDEAVGRVPALVRDGDVVLVKGSRRTGLDRLVTRLIEFVREDAA